MNKFRIHLSFQGFSIFLRQTFSGLPGVAGEPGPDATNGSDGHDGIPGKQGPVGPDAAQGDPGIKGFSGVDGPDGFQGEDGPPGKKGTKVMIFFAELANSKSI